MNANQNAVMNTEVADVVDNTGDTAPVPVILRRDAAGNPTVFLQGTLRLDSAGGTIEIWHMGAKRKTSTVPLSYYYATSRLDDTASSILENKFCEGWLPKFGIQVRHRLGKNLENRPDHPAHQKSANSTMQKEAHPFDKEMYMQKLQMALEASIRAAFKIVNEEMEIRH